MWARLARHVLPQMRRAPRDRSMTDKFNIDGQKFYRSRYSSKVRNGKQINLHVIVAEMVLGRPLPSGAIVHHANEDKSDNRPDNLVICPNRAYHNLIHARMDAFAATGDADSRKCQYCQEWGKVNSLWTLITKQGRRSWHKKCRSDYELARYYARKDAR